MQVHVCTSTCVRESERRGGVYSLTHREFRIVSIVTFRALTTASSSSSRMTEKKDKASAHAAVLDICRREVGHLSTRKFVHRLAASEDLVLRLDLARKLQKHIGCVNTVSFNAYGDIIVSGSDDRRVVLWDWETGRIKLSFDSGHNNNIFQAKFLPETDDRSIVTCAADGHVRHATLLECGKVETKLLGKHNGRAHKLGNEPTSPHVFYSCGEDGLVQHVSHHQI